MSAAPAAGAPMSDLPAPLCYEVCVDSVAGVLAAERAGADRVELCAGLLEGGVTPSLGAVRAAVAAAERIRVHVLIRARGGDFHYDALERQVMLTDITAVREAGPTAWSSVR